MFLYDLPKKHHTKKLRETKRIVRSLLSPGMQEHVAEHRGKKRNTCTKKYTICILYNQKKRTYSQPLSHYGYLFGTTTYVDYLMFSHLNPITITAPLPNATLTLGAIARNPNYWGSLVYPNCRGSCMQP